LFFYEGWLRIGNMKKIRVHELAKKKKLTSAEVIKLLKKKGLKNITATSSVDPGILDKVSEKRPADNNISHIFPVSVGSGALASKARRINEIKKEDPVTRPVKRDVAKGPSPKRPPVNGPSKPSPGKEKGKSGRLPYDLIAAIASIVALLLVGAVYLGQRNDRATLADVGSRLGEVQGAAAELKDGVTRNQAAIMDINDKILNSDEASLKSRLKSEAAVLKALSGNFKEPLRVRIDNLADGLSAL
jgi:hypothetical protein